MRTNYVYFGFVCDFGSWKYDAYSFGRFPSLPSFRSFVDKCTLRPDEELYVIRASLDSSSASLLRYDRVTRKLERLANGATIVSILHTCLEEYPLFKR